MCLEGTAPSVPNGGRFETCEEADGALPSKHSLVRPAPGRPSPLASRDKGRYQVSA